MAVPLLEILAINEAMAPYFGQQSLRNSLEANQFYSNTNWRASVTGSNFMKFCMYQGKYAGCEESLGIGESVVNNNLAINFVLK